MKTIESLSIIKPDIPVPAIKCLQKNVISKQIIFNSQTLVLFKSIIRFFISLSVIFLFNICIHFNLVFAQSTDVTTNLIIDPLLHFNNNEILSRNTLTENDYDDYESSGDVCFVSFPYDTPRNDSDIVIGYLANFKGRGTKNRKGLTISGAITYAVEKVNKEKILGDRRLRMICNDTKGTSLDGTTAILSLWSNGAVAFFGPEDMCQVEATLASAMNLPMISYKCANPSVYNKLYPTFLRTHPSDAILVRHIKTLLRHYSWCKFGIIWMKTESETINSLMLALRNGMDDGYCKHQKLFKITVDEGYEKITGKYWADLVERTHSITRIYLFIGEPEHLALFALAMKRKGLLDNGEYLVISIVYDEDSVGISFVNRPEHEKSLILQATKSVLFLAKKPLNETFHKFSDEVRKKNKDAPFWLTDKGLTNANQRRHVSAYAAYLYDAVMLYTQALRTVLDNSREKHPERNGAKIIQTIIARKWYESITGTKMTIDTTGDVGGSYGLFQISIEPKRYSSDAYSFQLPETQFSMNLVGTFKYSESSSSFEPLQSLTWVRQNHPPFDEPPCGFDGTGCTNESQDKTQSILTFSLSFILVFIMGLLYVVYRGWRYEQEIDGLQWALSDDDVVFDEDRKLLLNTSHMSIISNGSITRAMLRDCDILTGTFKGAVVAIKQFKLQAKSANSKPYDLLSRDTKKDMKYMKEMHHKNINPFIGACLHPKHPNSLFIVREYCGKGSLKDVLEKDEIKLEEEFLSSLIYDIMSGLNYLHKSDLKCHGNLKSTNCLITSRWSIKLTDFGLHKLQKLVEKNSEDDYYSLLWKAPELLQTSSDVMPESDIYSFGIIIHEVVVRKGPFGIQSLTESDDFKEKNDIAKMIIDKVTNSSDNSLPCRPNTQDIAVNNEIIDIMKHCWHEDPQARPTIDSVKLKFKTCHTFRPPSGNIMDKMMKLMEQYQDQLEDLVVKRTQQLNDEKRKTETLLHRMLPESVAKQLLKGDNVIPEVFDAVTIFFSDIVGFTSLSAESTPMEVVTFLNDLYTLFDSIISNYDVYKVETIGDAYMVVSGLPIRNGDKHCTEIASMALEMLESIKNFRIRHRPNEVLQLRIGIHQGPVVAGVVGLKMPRYCLFGDTVNTASRMESSGQALRIHISPDMKEALAPTRKYIIKERGKVYLKGKGEVLTYWLEGHIDGPQPRLVEDVSDYSKHNRKGLHVTLFQEEAFAGSRKGSLSGFDSKHGVHVSYFKRHGGQSVIANSILKLKNAYSNSCNTFLSNVNNTNEVQNSPKPKRTWNLKFLNGKLRSLSTHQPATDNVQIPLKDTHDNQRDGQGRNDRSIIKSPSYNMITYSLTGHSMAEMDQLGSVVSTDGLSSKHTVDSFLPFEELIQNDSHIDMKEIEDEGKPLLDNVEETSLNIKILRQTSFIEEDEDLFDKPNDRTNNEFHYDKVIKNKKQADNSSTNESLIDQNCNTTRTNLSTTNNNYYNDKDNQNGFESNTFTPQTVHYNNNLANISIDYHHHGQPNKANNEQDELSWMNMDTAIGQEDNLFLEGGDRNENQNNNKSTKNLKIKSFV